MTRRRSGPEVRRHRPRRGRAAEIGRDRKRPFRSDWDAVKERVMLAALRAKFTQHDDLKSILLGTGDAELVEHMANDDYWGNGGDGSGQNRLGSLLMQVRDELRVAGGVVVRSPDVANGRLTPAVH